MYVALLVIWWILAVFVLKDEFILWHILPYTESFESRNDVINDEVTRAIHKKYERIILYPMTANLLCHKLGEDIARIILMYFNVIEIESDLKA